MTHAELVRASARWLRKTHPVVLEDVKTTCVNEQPDVIGWKNHAASFVLECKASLEDYRRDSLKSFRHRAPERGMGVLRSYVAPPDLARIIAREESRRGMFGQEGTWGVLLVSQRGALSVLQKGRPFPDYAQHEEARLLVSAVRRVTEEWGRRMISPDAPLHPDGDPHPTASAIIKDLRKENASLRRKLREGKTEKHTDACDEYRRLLALEGKATLGVCVC